MAVFIIMLKEFEDDEKVIYWYGPNEEIMGQIQYDKKKRVINQLSPIVSKEFHDDFYFQRAGMRIAKMAIRENENFADRTIIES